jgi:hypothetical protein
VLVMDDGLQNPSLAKDLRIVVVDGATGFGNFHVLPAGPLRVGATRGIAAADLFVMMGEDRTGLRARLAARAPVVDAALEPDGDAAAAFAGRRVAAFAGIGRPEKFFATLERCGAVVVARAPFPDHHRFAAAELQRLADMAPRRRRDAGDHRQGSVRLPRRCARRSVVLPVRAVFARRRRWRCSTPSRRRPMYDPDRRSLGRRILDRAVGLAAAALFGLLPAARTRPRLGAVRRGRPCDRAAAARLAHGARQSAPRDARASTPRRASGSCARSGTISGASAAELPASATSSSLTARTEIVGGAILERIRASRPRRRSSSPRMPANWELSPRVLRDARHRASTSIYRTLEQPPACRRAGRRAFARQRAGKAPSPRARRARARPSRSALLQAGRPYGPAARPAA